MGVGGMGDALTGIAAAFLGQGWISGCGCRQPRWRMPLAEIRRAGDGERGLTPSDLIENTTRGGES